MFREVGPNLNNSVDFKNKISGAFLRASSHSVSTVFSVLDTASRFRIGQADRPGTDVSTNFGIDFSVTTKVLVCCIGGALTGLFLSLIDWSRLAILCVVPGSFALASWYIKAKLTQPLVPALGYGALFAFTFGVVLEALRESSSTKSSSN